MQYQIQIKDTNKRKLFIKTELVQRIIKILFFKFTNNSTYFTLLNSGFLPTNHKYFKTRVKNFCIVTGRSKAIHKKFKVSRIVLLQLGNKGYFFGLKKAS
jgi:ribosomal protein S14